MRELIEMPKRNLVIYTLFLLLSAFGLIACTSNTSTTERSVLVTRAGIDQYGVNDEGVLINDNGIIWFHDFETGVKVVACNLPDCEHEPYHRTGNPDPICLATHPSEGDIEAVGMYDNKIYMFVLEALRDSTVYQIDLEGSSRTELASFDWGIANMNDFELADGMAYFVATRFITNAEEYRSSALEYAVLSIDLDNGEVTQHGQIKDENFGDIRDFKKIDDKLYFYHYYLDYDGEYEFDDEIRSEYVNWFLNEIDLETNEERRIIDLNGEYGGLNYYDEDHFYFLTEDKTEFVAMDWDLTESEVLFSGEEIVLSARLSDGFIYIQNQIFDGSFYHYDLETKETTFFTRPDDELPIQSVVGDRLFFKANLENHQADLVMMNQSDFLSGETNYTYLKPRLNN